MNPPNWTKLFEEAVREAQANNDWDIEIYPTNLVHIDRTPSEQAFDVEMDGLANFFSGQDK